MTSEERKLLRKSKIKERDSLSISERTALSKKIVDRILASPEFQHAKTIMLYRGIRGEVRMNDLESAPTAAEKKLVFPLCISDTEMIALLPEDEEAWIDGYFGIREPMRERSLEISPEEIDFVICPCTVFDERGGRVGMGAGFYDRFLEKCTNAVVAAVAFECQKAENVERQPWDKKMDMIFTENRTYVSK